MILFKPMIFIIADIMICNFNFIMILFKPYIIKQGGSTLKQFQFHYDLI